MYPTALDAQDCSSSSFCRHPSPSISVSYALYIQLPNSDRLQLARVTVDCLDMPLQQFMDDTRLLNDTLSSSLLAFFTGSKVMAVETDHSLPQSLMRRFYV